MLPARGGMTHNESQLDAIKKALFKYDQKNDTKTVSGVSQCWVGTFRERQADRIKTLRDFCDGLEYQIQFEGQRMLATVEREGARLDWPITASVEMCFNSTRSSSPTTWERTTTNAISLFGQQHVQSPTFL
jgi:hypothetical protein